MKVTQVIVASILSSVAAILLGATTASHAAPVRIARANVDVLIEPRMNYKSLTDLAVVATESGVDGAVKLPQHLELPKETRTASSSASAETLHLQEQPLRLAVNDAQGHLTGSSSSSSISERLASSSSLSRSTTPTSGPSVSTRVGPKKGGRKRLDDGASEETFRMRALRRERVRRFNVRKQVSEGVEPGEDTFTQAEMDDAYRDRKRGFKIGSNTPAGKEKRAAKRALAQKLKAEAAVQAAQRALVEANARMAAAILGTSKSLANKMLHRSVPISPQARGTLPAAKDSTSKGATPVSEVSVASTSNHGPSASSPGGGGQETQASGKAEQSMLPDLNLPPPDTQ